MDMLTPSKEKAAPPTKQDIPFERQVEMMVAHLKETYSSSTFNTKQLMEILGVGEKKIRTWKRNGYLPVIPYTNRVSIIELAKFMVSKPA